MDVLDARQMIVWTDCQSQGDEPMVCFPLSFFSMYNALQFDDQLVHKMSVAAQICQAVL